MNSVTEHRTRTYVLEPGNATRYQFSLSETGAGLVMLTVHMGQINGAYTLEKDMIHRAREKHFASYILGKMPAIKFVNDIRGILWAVSVLIDDPTDLNGACQAIMEAYK